MNKWILFFQNPYNRVVYLTQEMEDKASMKYNSFLDFLYKDHYIKDPGELKNQLDRFKTILLNLDTGEWEVKEVIIDEQDVTFEEMLKLNEENSITTNSLKDQENKISPFEKLVENKKKILDNIYKKRREENDPLNRYR